MREGVLIRRRLERLVGSWVVSAPGKPGLSDSRLNLVLQRWVDLGLRKAVQKTHLYPTKRRLIQSASLPRCSLRSFG